MIYIWTDDNPTKTQLIVPDDIGYDFAVLDKKSGRNDNALMMREIAGKKRTLKFKMSIIADEDTSMLNKLCDQLENLPPFFYMLYPSPKGYMVQMECYLTKYSIKMRSCDEISNYAKWKDLSFDIVER
ncbi:hypothetical protein [Anaerorhabdus sp.]|uniref:hypothetical protein n=1 Tax=Anaerorhabdus sp. TaxID=1872524 RepID=UPI002FC6A7D2